MAQQARRTFFRLDASGISLVAVFSALMAVTTMYAVPLPFGGLTHFGNTVMWTASILFGGVIGGLAGGIGGMIADLILDPIWAPFTFFCKLASGLACGLASRGITSINRMAVVRIVAAVLVGAIANLLAYAPVYVLLLGSRAALLWLGRFFLPGPALVTYVATPIISIAVARADPRILAYRGSKKR
ncbi:MAG: ECF transporter S component [archaeon]